MHKLKFTILALLTFLGFNSAGKSVECDKLLSLIDNRAPATQAAQCIDII